MARPPPIGLAGASFPPPSTACPEPQAEQALAPHIGRAKPVGGLLGEGGGERKKKKKKKNVVALSLG